MKIWYKIYAMFFGKKGKLKTRNRCHKHPRSIPLGFTISFFLVALSSTSNKHELNDCHERWTVCCLSDKKNVETSPRKWQQKFNWYSAGWRMELNFVIKLVCYKDFNFTFRMKIENFILFFFSFWYQQIFESIVDCTGQIQRVRTT